MSKPAWSAEELVQQQRLVLHLETGTVGRAKHYYDGQKEHWRSTLDGKAVQGQVLELDTGDAFVVKEDAFVPLTEAESHTFVSLVQMLTSAITVTAGLAASARVPIDVYTAIAVSALETQARQLKAQGKRYAEQLRKQREASGERPRAKGADGGGREQRHGGHGDGDCGGGDGQEPGDRPAEGGGGEPEAGAGEGGQGAGGDEGGAAGRAGEAGESKRESGPDDGD